MRSHPSFRERLERGTLAITPLLVMTPSGRSPAPGENDALAGPVTPHQPLHRLEILVELGGADTARSPSRRHALASRALHVTCSCARSPTTFEKMRSESSWLFSVIVSAEISAPATCSTALRRASLRASSRAFASFPVDDGRLAGRLLGHRVRPGSAAKASRSQHQRRASLSPSSLRPPTWSGDDHHPAFGQVGVVRLGELLHVFGGDDQVASP